MIEKKLKLIITFSSTHSAIAFERRLCDFGRLIPVPVSISAGCGLCFMAETKDKTEILEEAKSDGLIFDGCIEMMI